MSFPYTTGIPNPPSDPANDVGDMQTNTNSINSWTAVDHVGFNNAAGGQHKQITFNDVAAPSSPVDPLSYLYTTVASSHPQLFFKNSNTTNQLTNLTIANSGTNYGITTPWGIKINWGYAVASLSGVSVTFAVAMSTTHAVTLGVNNTSSSATATFNSVTGTGCNIKSSNTNTVWYIAIGV